MPLIRYFLYINPGCISSTYLFFDSINESCFIEIYLEYTLIEIDRVKAISDWSVWITCLANTELNDKLM